MEKGAFSVRKKAFFSLMGSGDPFGICVTFWNYYRNYLCAVRHGNCLSL